MRILHFPTGGTIDAEPYEDPSAPPAFATVNHGSRASRYLAQEAKARPDVTVASLAICSVDSKLFSKSHDTLLFETVRSTQAKADRIVVTTGTDRMAEIARALKLNLHGMLEIPVVFTGAMLPLANGQQSDGYANLHRAAFGLSGLARGVYVAVGDLVEEAPFVKKDFARMCFYSTRAQPRYAPG